jgi:hypothetical protein
MRRCGGDGPVTGTCLLILAVLTLAGCDEAEKLAEPGGEAAIEVGTGELTVMEGGEPVAYAVSLGRAPVDTVRVDIKATNGDVVAIPDSLIFAPQDWRRARAVAVQAVDDRLVEGEHTDTLEHAVTSDDSVFAALSLPSIAVVVGDNDVHSVTAMPTEMNLVEGGLPGTYSVVLGARPEADVFVLTRAVPAVVGITVVPDTLIFAVDDWEVPRQVSVAAVADGIPEDSPQLAVVTHTILSVDEAYRNVEPPVVVVRASDETAPFLAVAGTVVGEADGLASVLVRLSTGTEETVTVDLVTADGSARADEDYVALSTTLAFAPGVTAIAQEIPLIDDAWPETGEFFNVVLERAQHALIGTGGTICYIEDDDRPNLSATDVAVDESEGALVFQLELSTVSPLDVRATVTTVPGSATAGEDYVALDSVVTIPAGETAAEVAVTVMDDDVPETNEVVFLSVTAPENAVIDDGVITGTIVDDDGEIVFASDITAAESDGTATFELTLTQATAADVRVVVATAAGSAQPGLDFVAIDETVTIPAGEITATLPVTLVDDEVPELSESFELRLVSAEGASLVDDTALCTVTDADLPELGVADLTVDENAGAADFQLALSIAAPWDVNATVATEPGTAVAPADYASVSTLVTIPAGSMAASVPVSIVNDVAPEGDEWFLLRIAAADGAEAQAGPARATIADNDFPLLSVADEVAFESSGEAVFTVFLSGPSAVDVTVRVDTQDLAAEEDVDYIGWHATLTIPAGRTAKTVTVPIIDDVVVENDEAFALLMSEAGNAGFLDASAVGVIVDDD